jgi:uncharacterized protein (DUF362 family)
MSRRLTRRQLLTGSAGLFAAGCGIQQRPMTPSSVSIVKAPAYDQSVYDIVRRLVTAHVGDVRGKRILLKPNLVEFEPGSCINTHPILVHAAYEAFQALGAAHVTIAEGPGHRRNTLDLADAAGYFHTVPGFEDKFVDLNLDEVTRVRPEKQFSRINKLYLPNSVLGADLLVSMPKLKTHHWAGATLSMKNLFGTVPSGIYGWPKNVLHWAGIDESIADLHGAYPRQFAIVDGIIGMEGNGPIQGTPKHAGVLVACCRIMKIDPLQIQYLRLTAGRPNTHITESNILQIGETIESVATPFELIPEFRRIRLENS